MGNSNTENENLWEIVPAATSIDFSNSDNC